MERCIRSFRWGTFEEISNSSRVLAEIFEGKKNKLVLEHDFLLKRLTVLAFGLRGLVLGESL